MPHINSSKVKSIIIGVNSVGPIMASQVIPKVLNRIYTNWNRFLSCTFSALRTNCTNNIKPLIFCLPDCSGARACFCPYMGCRALPAKACFILKPYLYKRNASFGYLVADVNYNVVRHSHLTTRLIPLPEYAPHGRRMLCF